MNILNLTAISTLLLILMSGCGKSDESAPNFDQTPLTPEKELTDVEFLREHYDKADLVCDVLIKAQRPGNTKGKIEYSEVMWDLLKNNEKNKKIYINESLLNIRVNLEMDFNVKVVRGGIKTSSSPLSYVYLTGKRLLKVYESNGEDNCGYAVGGPYYIAQKELSSNEKIYEGYSQKHRKSSWGPENNKHDCKRAIDLDSEGAQDWNSEMSINCIISTIPKS